jgi:tetratricopeptide (TPR) repeat protein
MSQVKYIIFIAFLLLANCNTFAQKTERDYIRKGNKLFKEKSFVQAEVNYRKALEKNPNSTEALYNLGNTLSQQQKLKEAMQQYTSASKNEKSKAKLAKIYHNAGVLFYAAKHYQEAVQSYKQSLRNNPDDDETRYNLALAMKMLKDQQNQDKNKDKNKNKDKDKDKKKKEDEKKKQQDQQKKDDKQKQQPKPQPEKNKMSKENAEQLLNAAMQDEKQLQEKAKKQLKNQGRNLDKDW